MTRILWAAPGSRHFSTGVDRGVLYLQNRSGVPWNGLLAVNEAPSGADVVEGYYDGVKFLTRATREEFAATIEAFSYPLEFEEYDGVWDQTTGQVRKSFGFSYRTLLGDDLTELGYNYLIHIVYNATAAPVAKNFSTVSDSSDAMTFGWNITTAPEFVDGRFGSHLIIDSRVAYPWAVEELESRLYGSPTQEAHLPSAQEVFDLFEDSSILTITDNGDGTWTAEGPDEAIQMLDADTFEITWPSAVYLDAVTYQISSL